MRIVRTKTVLLLALTAAGLSGLGGCPPSGGEASPLTGTWSGTLNYHFAVAYSGSAPTTMDFTFPYSVTFNLAGEAEALSLPTGAGGLESMDGLAKAGDSAHFDMQVGTGDTQMAIAYTITVRSVSRDADSYSITLDLTYVATGYMAYTMTGTETISYAVQPDGSLKYDCNLDFTGNLGGQAMTETMTLTATLSRQ